jgi:phenylacetate-coenzyme A ligase PaaK-like adenylate-forming protein
MTKIEGRSDAILSLPDGRTLSPRTITITMGRFPLNKNIEQFKVIQKRIDTFEIQLKMENSPTAHQLMENGTLEKEIITHFKSQLGIENDEVNFIIHFVDEIPISKNGKLQIVESKIGL